MPDDVTTAELARRLAELGTALERSTTRIYVRLDNLEQTFVRRDVLDERLRTLDAKIEDVREDLAAYRRERDAVIIRTERRITLAWTALLAPVIVGVILLIIQRGGV